MANAAAIDSLLRRAVHAQDVPGVAAVAATDRGVIYAGAFGPRQLGAGAPMTPDTVVWIASLTKAVTTAAALQLAERGRMRLDAPAAEYVPALAEVRVLDGFDGSGSPRLRPPRRPITLRHLLTHTAGFSYEFWNPDILRYQAATGTPGIITFEPAALTTPLVCDPGERWEYGIGVDWAGRVVEAVAGRRLGDYLRDDLLGPLGMHDTSFRPSDAQRERSASMHVRGQDGALAAAPSGLPADPPLDLGGAGLYGTAADYLRFTRMLLRDGRSDEGYQVLSPVTVRAMGQNQIGDLDCGRLRSAVPAVSRDPDFFPGMRPRWGLGFLINPARGPHGRSPGSLAWAGLANCYYWIDPARRVTGVFVTQLLPFFDPRAVALFGAFEEAVYRSLDAQGA